MSPQRRKGRGGGAGKVVAPPPSTAPLAAIDSPPLLPIKLSRQRGKSLAGILPPPCNSSIPPTLSHSTTLSAKSKSKERTRSITASSASSRDALLSVAGLCYARAASKSGKCMDSTGVHCPPSSRGIPRSRKCTNTTNCGRVSVVGSAIVHARPRRGVHDKEGMKVSKDSVLTQDSSHMDASRSRKSESCRSSLQKEDLGEGLRWSTMALPSHIKKMGDGDEKTLTEGKSAKQWLAALSHRRASLEGNPWADGPLYVSSPDRRYSMGSSVMSIATSLQSGCEEGLDDDDSVRVSDEFENQKDIMPSEIPRALMAWQTDMYGHASPSSELLVESGRENISASSIGTLRVSFETKKNQALSNAHDQPGERRASLSSSISNRELVHANADNAVDSDRHEALDKPNSSTSLHQRLALLEGRVSQIASELRRTKEMLDYNNPSTSVVLLADIQGKILSIERAITAGTSEKDSICQQDAPMEEGLHKSQINKVPAHRDSDGFHRTGANGFDKSSILELSHQSLSPNLPNSASRKTDRLESDQQELEDRLFPHRKLLKSRMSLHERVVESRAALHSKLEDAVPQRFSMQNVSAFDAAPPSLEGILTSRYEKLHHLEKAFVKGDLLTASKSALPSVNGDAVQHLNVHSGNSGEPHVVKMHCASGQDVPYIAKIGFQEVAQAESPLHFLQCDESLQIKSSETQDDLALDDELEVDSDELQADQLRPIGERVAMAGWYACEGEAIVLVHDDGCCSFYDVANMEEKAVYECPKGYPAISWNDCWLIRAAGSDGMANKYIVAATSGSALDAGFCSWDFHSRVVAAHHSEDHFNWLDLNASAHSSPVDRSPEVDTSRSLHHFRSSNETASHAFGSSQTKADVGFSSNIFSRWSVCNESSQWWYRPCGPLMASAGSSLKHVTLYDIRDGETIMTWETKQPVLCLESSSPLQWRNRGKLALVEEQAISIWDVNTLDSQCLHYIELLGKQIRAFHVHNADAEYSGGVRQRLSSSDMVAFDGVCCTRNDVNVLDFRVPSGIGLCLPTIRQEMQSVFARGNTIFTGGMSASFKCVMQQWSVRMGRPVCTYAFPPSPSHYTHLSLTQVWGSSSAVMAVNGNGLHIFKGYKETEDGQCGLLEEVKDLKESPDLFDPSFDYANSRILLISRDRPASWCYWPL